MRKDLKESVRIAFIDGPKAFSKEMELPFSYIKDDTLYVIDQVNDTAVKIGTIDENGDFMPSRELIGRAIAEVIEKVIN